MRYVILTYLFVLGICAGSMAQVDTTGIDTGLMKPPLDTVLTDSAATDTLGSEERPPPFTIIPWRKRHSLSSRMATNDSLLRWQTWPDWTHKKNRDPGVITFRLGTVGRSNALLIDAHEPRHQQLYWEDIPMHDPVSGTVNWNVLPQHKVESVYEDVGGITHESNFYLKQYYVNKPLTRLIFDESKFDRRSLEFWMTQNFSQKTNLEISYWDRRGGGGYPNSTFQGNQIFARAYHQPDNQQLLKLRFLTGKRSLGEPFGYLIPDLNNYNFDLFTTTPVQAGGRSETGFSKLALSYHRRRPDSTAVAENFRAGLFVENRKREVTYSSDTTGYHIQSAGAFAHKWIDWHPIRLEGSVTYQLFTSKQGEQSALERNGWSLLRAKASSIFQPLDWWSVTGEVEYSTRDDDYTGYSVGAETEVAFGDNFSLAAGASRGTVMPTPQQLYWNSNEYRGTPGLANEKIEEVHGSVSLRFFRKMTAGAKGQMKMLEDAHLVNSNNDFVNADQYTSLSSTGYLDFASTHVELSASATLHQYLNLRLNPTESIPDFTTQRIWLKGGAYWKGYLFDRATYIKAGVSGMFSPQPYLAGHYHTELDYWQPASGDQRLPWFSRLDVDISARVRAIMFVLRFENVLDDVSQLGYFETAKYPMLPRRFLFGIRAQFNN